MNKIKESANMNFCIDKMTNEEMKEHCKKLFPTLKRWKVK